MGRFKSKSIETLCVQAGYEAKNGEPRITPLVQSTTYQYDSADEVADLFDLIMLLTEWKHLSVRRHMNSCSYVRTRLTDLTSCNMC